MNTKQIDIKGGNNQILPNAVQAVQVVSSQIRAYLWSLYLCAEQKF